MAEINRVEELSQKLLAGVQETFQSDNYQRYLKFVSSFHDYSLRNTILIMQQCGNATQVKGYQAWQKFGRYVKRNEKGIAIFAPSKVRVKRKNPMVDEFGRTQLNADGTPLTQEEEHTILKFNVTHVFDLSQTDGDPLPQICGELQGSVNNFQAIFSAVKLISPYKIEFERITNGSKGYCDHRNSRIAINMGMSEEQIVKTLIHEFAHAVLHSQTEKNREQREVEAESVAYIVSDCLGVDTSSYSFGYVADWSNGMPVEELQNILEHIQSTANQIIYSVQAEMKQLEKSVIQQETEIPNLENRLHHAAEITSATHQDKEMRNLEKRIS